MKNITVIIPAFNRPDLLRIALKSVDCQTAKEYIKKVIVSENGLNSISQFVCNEFNDLPITYVLQQPQLPVLSHLKWLMSQERQGYVALLCDDDWWNPYHLEIAIRSLGKSSGNIAYFSNFIYAGDESSLKLHLYHGLKVLHIGQPNFSSTSLTSYSQDDILALTVLVTPFHFSAMVCEGAVLSEAVEIFDSVHPTYADRMLWATLSTHGDLLFNPLVTCVVRLHEEMDSKRYSSMEWRIKAQQGSLQILALAATKERSIKEKLNLLYSNASVEDSEFILNELSNIFTNREELSWFIGYNDILKRMAQERRRQMSARNILTRVLRKVASAF